MAGRRNALESSATDALPIASRFGGGEAVRHALTGKKGTFVGSEREGWNTVKTSNGSAIWTDALTELDVAEVSE